MERPLDLSRATREALIAVSVRQREQIAELEQEMTVPQVEGAVELAEMTRLTDRVGALPAALEPP